MTVIHRDDRINDQLTLAFAMTLNDSMPEADLTVHIFINGLSLMNTAARLERTRLGISTQPDRVGPFGGLLFSPGLRDVFDGTCAQDHADFDGCMGLLACGCLIVSCGGVAARVTRTASHVVWARFENANDPDVRYPDLGPFRFGIAQYDAEVRAMLDLGATLDSCVVYSSWATFEDPARIAVESEGEAIYQARGGGSLP